MNNQAHALNLPAGEEVIRQMVDRIVQKFQPEKVILFGSYARGNPTKDSDVDLLVVMEYEGSNRRVMVEIYNAIGVMGVPKDILVFNAEQVSLYSKVAGTVIREALREGRVVYERSI